MFTNRLTRTTAILFSIFLFLILLFGGAALLLHSPPTVTADAPAASFDAPQVPMSDPIHISTITQLQAIGVDPDYPLNGHYLLTQDIDANGVDFQPIGGDFETPIPFTGIFDGQDYTIANLTIDKPDLNRAGLFRYLADDAVVRNLHLESVTVTGGWFEVGALAGTSENSTISNCSMTGVVSGGEAVGGLVGVSVNGSIIDSHVSGIVNGGATVGGLAGAAIGLVTDSYAHVTVTGEHVAGGLAGSSSGEIINSYATGAVIATYGYGGGLVASQWDGVIVSSYATGDVNGEFVIGGLVGDSSGDIVGSYATGDVTGLDGNIGGLVGWHITGVISSSYATGAVMGGVHTTGGLVGTNEAAVKASYATGPVSLASSGEGAIGGLVGGNHSSGVIEDSYAIGAVSEGLVSGGLAAYNDGTILSSYWNIETSGQDVSDGGEGRTTAEMTHPYAANTYLGWDFDEIWAADSGYSQNNGYPYLRLIGPPPPPAPTVTGITPSSGENTGALSITVTGTYFQVSATLMLTRTNQPDIVASDVVVSDTTSLTGVIDLNGAALGDWTVVVTNPDNQFGQLPLGFTIILPDDATEAPIDPETGGTLVYTDTQGTTFSVAVPANGITESVTLVHMPMGPATPPTGLAFAGLAFNLSAYQDGVPLSGFTFLQPVLVTIVYQDALIAGLDEETLLLTYWDEDAAMWRDVAETCTPPSTYIRDLENNTLSVEICHLTNFALFGESEEGFTLYLPIVVRE